jgi:hypothetical protein
MVLFIVCYAGKITLVQDKDGYTGCYTELYYNQDHWDKRWLFNEWINQMASFASQKSFAKNGSTTIGQAADYCC